MPPASPPSNGRYEDIVALLKRTTPSFSRSVEYSLVSRSDDLPGVILAAYGRFLGRISKEMPQSVEFEQGLAALASAREWPDPRVATSIRDEFIEALDGDEAAIKAMRPHLSDNLAADLDSVLGASTSG